MIKVLASLPITVKPVIYFTLYATRSRSLLFRETSIPKIINEWIAYYYDPERFYNFIDEKFTLENDGFFRWEGLRYFLYEYEAWLQQVGKQSSSKLEWASMVAKGKDNVSIEHIYPQTAKKDYWLHRYEHLSKQQKYRLTHSLGNLLPLSISKNASLQNDGFDIKKNNGSGVGYYNGSAAENEVAQYEEWLPSDIKKRGVDLLNFMEKRWKIILGDNDFKLKLLHLSDIETIPKDHPFIEAKSA